jgi:hypothetical protein
VPLARIERVEVSHGGNEVKFHTVKEGIPIKFEFLVGSGDPGSRIHSGSAE